MLSQSLIASLFTLLLQQQAQAIPLTRRDPPAWTTTPYDIIIIGAGPAGIIAADKFSAAGKNTLLLEQGGPSYSITGGTQKPSWLSSTSLSRVDVPGLYSSIYGDQGSLTCGNWVHAFGGCTIGGSSAINAGLFFQPPESDWERYFPEGWKYDDVLPAIQRLNARQSSESVTSQDGKLYLQDIYQAAKSWLVGEDATGFAETDFKSDPNAIGEQAVFGHPVYDYNSGQRGGPATTYLQSALGRSNFLLQSGVKAKYIVHDKTSAIAQPSTTAEPTCPSADGTVFTDGQGVIYKIYCNQDNNQLSYTGISISTGGFAACFSLCDADATAHGCGGFSFVGSDSGVCYLRNNEGSYTPNSAVISAYKTTDNSGNGSSTLSTASAVIATVNGVDLPINLAAGGRVIVSAGALASPQILMWSGIGDSSTLSTLQAAGILQPDMTPDNWVINPSIGAGLFDNPNTFIEMRSPQVQSYVYNYSDVNAVDANLYTSSRSGPYSFAGQLAVFWNTTTHPDGSVAGFQGTIGSSGYSDYTDSHTVTLNVYGTSGLKSRGKVVLDSAGIAGPSGDVYYSSPQDAQDIAGFISGIFGRLNGADDGGWEVLNMDSTWSIDQIANYITTWSAYARGQVNHWSSSCSLHGTCADANAQVVGTANVHVVDASILEPLSVNPQMGVMIAAEHVVERILGL